MKDNPEYHSLQLVDYTQVQALLAAAIEPLLKRIKQLEAGQSEWVDTKEALRLTGLKSGETLKVERERKGTKLIYKMEGITSKQPRYLRSSLIAYNEARTKRHLPGRTLD